MTAGTREREGHGERQERLQNVPEMQNKQLSLGTSTAQSFILSSSSYPRFYILDVWENRVRHNSKGEPDRTKGTQRGTPCFP